VYGHWATLVSRTEPALRTEIFFIACSSDLVLGRIRAESIVSSTRAVHAVLRTISEQDNHRPTIDRTMNNGVHYRYFGSSGRDLT
jgi:hypothetical protein